MSWISPTDQERHFVNEISDEEQKRVLQILSLALRLDFRLLRNTRAEFAPLAPTEIELEIWHSDALYKRSVRGALIREGIARVLVDELAHDARLYQQASEFIDEQTCHWSDFDRLEQNLRLATRTGYQQVLQKGYLRILKTLLEAQQQDPERRELARMIKGALPHLTPDSELYGYLDQYVGAALGSLFPETTPMASQHRTMPSWLMGVVPAGMPQAVGIRIYRGTLVGERPQPELPQIVVNLPMPTKILITPDGDTDNARWASLFPGCRIAISESARSIQLKTLNGDCWLVEIDQGTNKKGEIGGSGDKQSVRRLILVHLPQDKALAQRITEWLEGKNIQVERREEKLEQVRSEPGEQPVVCLWSRLASDYWSKIPDPKGALPPGLLIRTDSEASIPAGSQPGHSLDLFGWDGREDSAGAERLLQAVQALLEPGLENQIQALIDEINDPKTEPPRRLEIGDQLAELGDLRPGVGVREIEVPDDSTVAEETAESEEAKFTEVAFSPEVQKLLDELNDIKTEPPRRLKIGDELDRLGDPRKGVGLDERGLPEIDWVEIPGGPFIYQDGETLDLPTFYISRYPVTNAQFQAFIDAGGYDKPGDKVKRAIKRFQQTNEREEDWWADLKQPKPDKSTWSQGNRPRTDVDWYESVAFTRWLTVALGYEVRLPTDQEWEKAARGTEGLIYPWGNEYQSGYANVDEKEQKSGPWYLEQTTAVGMYPHGRSPQGLEDMAGTVWEWCLNKYDQPDMTTPDASGESRVLRGGSWVGYADGARAVARYGGVPGYRGGRGGFRLLSSVPIADR